MKVKTIPTGFLEENCYIIDIGNGNAVAIDCGDDSEKILNYLSSNSLILKKILLTHGHFDHINAVEEIAEKTGAEVFIHKNDEPMLKSARENLAYSIPGYTFIPFSGQAKTIEDGDIIKQDNLEFKVMHTKGHTQGGVCYTCEDSIFSGDTLFAGEVGRTDFPGGSYTEILASVKKLASLEGDYIVYPGHGPSSTLEIERKTNMYMNM